MRVALPLIAGAAGGDRDGTTAAPPPMRTDANGCRMIVPLDLGAGGVVLFAGTMREGRPFAGYLDTGSADTAGPSLRFRGADGLPVADRREARRACTIASAGATAASARLRAAGNQASARFYDGWVRILACCVDRAE